MSEKRSRGLANRKRRKPARERKKRRLRTELKKIRAMLDAVESEYLRRTTDPWGHGGGRRRLVRSPYPRL